MRLQKYLSYGLFEGRKVHANIPKENQNGTCYQDALMYMMDNDDDDLYLCHGLVTGQGAIKGIVYNHAWVEKGNTVIDETVPIEMPKAVYYALGRINKKTVFRYNHNEMRKKATKFRTYGPWEKVLLDNEY